jgi:hypothetical protein
MHEALKERILLSNKNFDVKKVSKSIVVYHQMKNNISQKTGYLSQSRYQNAMMLSTDDNGNDPDGVFESVSASQTADGLMLALQNQEMSSVQNNNDFDPNNLEQFYLRKKKITANNKNLPAFHQNGSAITAATSGMNVPRLKEK